MDENGPVTTFDDLHKMVFLGRHFVGPRAPIADYRIAAGLLVERWNDYTRRYIKARRPNPTLEIEWFYKNGGHADDTTVPITQGAIDELLRQGLVSGTPQMGYTDMSRLIITDRGRRRVIQEFVKGGTVHDVLSSGASLDMRTGHVDWR